MAFILRDFLMSEVGTGSKFDIINPKYTEGQELPLETFKRV
jgi:hypothetical protein